MRSPHVCALTGLTTRQLDYLTRSPDSAPLIAPHVPHRGSGSRRYWPPEVVRRLMIAGHVMRSRGPAHQYGSRFTRHGDLPALTAELLEGPRPPDAGWLILGGPSSTLPTVSYAVTDDQLVDLVWHAGPCQVADYDLHRIAVDHGAPDLAEVLAGDVPYAWMTTDERERHARERHARRQLIGTAP